MSSANGEMRVRLDDVLKAHRLLSAHRCSCGWEGDSATTHIIDAIGLEQVGTWLLPEAYGTDYDHFTQTKCETKPGMCVAVYALRQSDSRSES